MWLLWEVFSYDMTGCLLMAEWDSSNVPLSFDFIVVLLQGIPVLRISGWTVMLWFIKRNMYLVLVSFSDIAL